MQRRHPRIDVSCRRLGSSGPQPASQTTNLKSQISDLRFRIPLFLRGFRTRPAKFDKQQSIRGGFSLAEASFAVMLVGILMLAALQSLGASKRREYDTVQRLRGQQLAAALMNEILLQAYRDPDTNESATCGPDIGESTGNRSLFDDVDDYAGWQASPPVDRSGTVIPGFDGWTRRVDVVWADPVTFQPTMATKTDLKQITVTVSKDDAVLGSLVGYRSVGWVETLPAPSDATGNHVPVAVATSPNLNRRVNQSVVFYATSSRDQDGDYLSYVWNFGDGTKGTGGIANHTYSSPGNFTCTLTVYDGRGGVGTAALTAVITP